MSENKKENANLDLLDEENEPILASEEEQKNKNKKKNSYIKYILNIAIVLIVTICSFCISFFQDFDNIVNSFSSVDWWWVLASFGLVVLAALIRALIYFCFARLYTRKYYYHQALAIDSIGTFYNGVTPSASGGQFMQAYTYKKQGLPISAGASIMVMASMIYQFVLIVFGILSLIFESETIFSISVVDINGIHFPIYVLIILGFGLNIAFIGLLLLMSYSRHFHHFILGPCISFLHYIHIIKKPDKSRENLRIQVENFKIELKRLLSNIPFTILIVFLYSLSMIATFAVPCFVGKALGAEYQITWFSLWDSIFFSNFHQMITGLIPIPGSAGVSEYFFNQLFGTFYNFAQNATAKTTAAQIIWRFLTFTLPLFLCGIVTAFYRASPKEQIQKRNINRQTFVALQRETYIERKQSADTLYETTRLTRQAIMSSLRLRNKKEAEEKEKIKQEKEKNNKLEKNVKSGFKIDENKSKHHPFNDSEWNEIDIGDDD